MPDAKTQSRNEMFFALRRLYYGGQIRMKAIIYTSNTGSTAEYAQLLGKELNLPVHSLQQTKNKVPAGSEIEGSY